jgi:outer membrane receptor protein involved in Fe transport
MSILLAMPHISIAQQSEDDKSQTNTDERTLEVIMVTANKRIENIREIAGSVSALTGDQLSKMGADDLGDYIANLPGVHFNDYQAGASHVVIRGVATSTYHENGQDVVGYHLNGVPLNEPGFPIAVPDIDTFDLERVEVLRGPQGTLYGAGSLGGSVNYITNKADATQYDAAIETSLARTKGLDENNSSFKAMLNVPIIDDKLAVRLVGGTRFVAGHLDNVILNEDGSNDLKVNTGRLNIVYTPSVDTTVDWTSLYQSIDSDDQTYGFVPGFERFGSRFPEYQNTQVTMHTVQLDHSFENFALTTLAGVANKKSDLAFDFGQQGLFGADFAENRSIAEADIEHYEARLTSQGNTDITWVVGVSYSTSDRISISGLYQEGVSEYIDNNPDLFGGNASSVLTPNDFTARDDVFEQENEDFAVFGEIGYEITDDFTMTFGGRYFRSESELLSYAAPSVFGENEFTTDTTVNPKVPRYSETGFNPKVTAKYKLDGETLVYASYAEGFRVGGANPNPVSVTGVEGSESFNSDSTQNYEIGLKRDFFNNSLQVDVAAFLINWDDIQVRLYSPAPYYYAYTVNASGAENSGVEFSGKWQATDSLDLNLSLTYLNAEISETDAGFNEGDRLPGSSKWSVAANMTYYFDDVVFEPQVSMDYRYATEAPESFAENTVYSQDFHMLDLHAIFTIDEQVSVSLFIDNVLDEYGVLGSPFGHFFETPVASVLRPRTAGIKFNWKFD